MDHRIGIGRLIAQLLDAEDIGEGLQILHARILESVRRLLAESGAIDKEEHTAEALHLQQTVDQSNTGLGLARSCRHRHQHVPPPLGDARLDSADSILLIVSHGEAVVEWLMRESFVRLYLIPLQQVDEAFG